METVLPHKLETRSWTVNGKVGKPCQGLSDVCVGPRHSFVYGPPGLGCTSFSPENPPESPLLMHPPLVSLDQPGPQMLGSLHEESHSLTPSPSPRRPCVHTSLGSPLKHSALLTLSKRFYAFHRLSRLFF